jgi:hypothetical protein
MARPFLHLHPFQGSLNQYLIRIGWNSETAATSNPALHNRANVIRGM